jgi:hypothetical protein
MLAPALNLANSQALTCKAAFQRKTPSRNPAEPFHLQKRGHARPQAVPD